ncbi:hypothetical protein AB4Z01_01425 [Inquilinus sp. YAF38]|uniref:hypothetical protein n=1 Tax=Inquilinus sp. YAF38 TaxID=3233084 RepID=UPI003F8F69DB
MHNSIAPKREAASDGLAALFNSIETRSGIAGVSSRAIGPNEAAFRAMHLDLGEICAALRAADLDPPLVTVCADVLRIPDRLDWTLRRTELVIAARRIQSDGYATFNLDYRDSTTASLTVFTDEVDGRFQAIAMTAPDGPQPAAFFFDAPPATGGTRIHLPLRQPVETSLGSMRDLPPRAMTVVEQALQIECAVASLLREQRPDLAGAMIGWIKSWSADVPGLARIAAELDKLLAAQAGATLTSLSSWQKNAMAATG